MDACEGFDTACPLGPWIVTRDDVDWKDAKISFTLNGEDVPMASGTTANLIHGIPERASRRQVSFTTLLPGDVIMTGTPNASGHLDPVTRRSCTSRASAICATWWCAADFRLAGGLWIRRVCNVS